MNDFANRPGGVLFKKERKTNPNQPDYDGNIVLDPAVVTELYALISRGQPAKIELAAWLKQSKAGKPFLSLSGQMPRQQQQQRPTQQQSHSSFDDDSIPF